MVSSCWLVFFPAAMHILFSLCVHYVLKLLLLLIIDLIKYGMLKTSSKMHTPVLKHLVICLSFNTVLQDLGNFSLSTFLSLFLTSVVCAPLPAMCKLRLQLIGKW